MSDLLSISGNAVMAYQQALGTVSNNIANVATDGYSRQEVKLQAGAPSKVGNAFIGTGVVFDQVQRQYSAFADANLRNSNSDLQSQAPMVTYANRVIDVMSGASTGLVSSLDKFFASARSLSADPASTVLRGAFVRDAQGLTSSFGELSSQLDLVDTETSQAIQTSVGQINTLSQQLAQVNKQLSRTDSVDRQPAELLDQRDLLLRKLSDFSHLNTSFKPNGEVLVSLGSALTHDVIVDGGTATLVGVDLKAAASGKISLVLDPYGKPSALSGVTSGQLAGLMSFREQVLSSTRNALDFLATTVVKAVNDVHSQGIDGYGQKAGNLFAIDPKASSVAGGLSVVVTDPMRIAAAAQFRVIKDANNTSGANANVVYAPSPLLGPGNLADLFVNNPHPSAGRPIELTSNKPVMAVAAIPGGMHDVSVYLDGAQAGQQLQVITRDGRQLLGPPLDAAAQAQVMSPGQGMAAGATYSTAYLNATGDKSYQGINVFYGARADVLSQQKYDIKGAISPPGVIPALLSGNRMTAGQTGTVLAAGALKLNGIPLGALAPSAGNNTLQADDVAAWLNGVATGVTATATNEIRVPVASLNLNNNLTLNGQAISSSGFTSADDMLQAINIQTTNTGVVASFSRAGELVLTNVSDQQGKDITVGSVGSTSNALSITNNTYTGQIQIQRVPGVGQDTPVQLSFGVGGGPTDLAKLGFQSNSTLAIPAQLSGNRMTAGQTGTVVASGAIKLNGIDLGPLTPGAGNATLQASDIADWLTAAAAPGVTASATNEVRVPAANLKLLSTLVINGQTITKPSTGFASAADMVQAINDKTTNTHVVASFSRDGEVVLTNINGEQGKDITLGSVASTGNALNMTDGVYTGQVQIQRTLVNGQDTPIELSFGAGGGPADLAKLGFRTSATIKGALPEDVLVFVSGGAGKASVAASYSGSPADTASVLRAQPLKLTFTADNSYTITDTTTGTVLAERSYDASQLTAGIDYRGLKLSFTTAPNAGDSFALDGNTDGTGNNENMLMLTALESAKLVGGKTISTTYINQVNDMGNISRQATIAQQALTVVHDQAVTSRDQISGVSLDEEAANLIRFQQAYQASAKVMQVAGTLFDAVLAVH